MENCTVIVLDTSINVPTFKTRICTNVNCAFKVNHAMKA